jgi:hypothetical protein
MSLIGVRDSRRSGSIRQTVLLVALFQAVYACTSSGNVFRAPDEFEVYFQAEHLVDAGDISVPQTLAIRQPVIVDGRVVGSQSMFFGKTGRDGRPYAPYGPLAAILALPHHLLGRAAAAAAGVPRAPLPGGIAWLIVVGGVTMLATATAGALTVAGFHRAVTALGAPARDALGLSLMLGGATVVWPYSTSFFSEAWQAAAFIWAAALLLDAREGTRVGPGCSAADNSPAGNAGSSCAARVALSAALVAAAGLTKVTSLIFAPAFVVAALVDSSIDRRQRLKTAAALTAGIVAATAAHLVWNVYRFGSPFEFGYDWSETVPHLPARAFLIADVPRGLAVLLFSPGKSVVIWAPPLILAAVGFGRFWRRERAVATGVAAAVCAGLLFYAAYLFPEGGYSHGPRNLVPIVPLMLLPALAAREVLAARTFRALTVACAAGGAIVALLATSVSYLEDQSLGGDLTAGARTVYYERIEPPPGRVWNRYRLDYLPFLATMRSPDWLTATNVGQGPDYFALHLLQARSQLPDGQSIPLWFVWVWPAGWWTAAVLSGVALRSSAAHS